MAALLVRVEKKDIEEIEEGNSGGTDKLISNIKRSRNLSINHYNIFDYILELKLEFLIN